MVDSEAGMGQPGFFDLDERYAALSEAGDPLERLGAVIDFERLPAGEGVEAIGRVEGRRPPMIR